MPKPRKARAIGFNHLALEVGDIDVQGAGQITVTGLTTTEPGGQTFTLLETAQRGVFRGTIPLISSTNAPLAVFLPLAMRSDANGSLVAPGSRLRR